MKDRKDIKNVRDDFSEILPVVSVYDIPRHYLCYCYIEIDRGIHVIEIDRGIHGIVL